MSQNHTINIDLFGDSVPEELIIISETLKELGHEIYLVGGAIRDIVHFGSTDKAHVRDTDFDFATDATPHEVMKAFKGKRLFTVPTGLQHGTVVVVIHNRNFEITTFRVESDYTDGRHPDKVEFSQSIVEDLSRRDFTINAMAYDVIEKKLIDPFNGKEDIEKQLIRTVGSALERFREDGLRPVRACRIAAQMNYSIDEETLKAIPETIEVVKKVSAERFHDELMKLMKTEKPSVGIEYMRETGILDFMMPELMEGYGIEQNEFHKYEVYYHNLYTCDAVPPQYPLVRMAALLHDIGKPRSKAFALKIGNGNVFYNHEIIGERMAKKLLRHLKFSKQEIDLITHLIHMHMFYYTRDWTDGAVRRFLKKFDGEIEFLDLLFILRRADRVGSGKREGDGRILHAFRARIDKIMEKDNALKVTDLDIDGNILMTHFGLKPGKIIGEILNFMLELVLDDPDLNERESLLKIAREYLDDSGNEDNQKKE